MFLVLDLLHNVAFLKLSFYDQEIVRWRYRLVIRECNSCSILRAVCNCAALYWQFECAINCLVSLSFCSVGAYFGDECQWYYVGVWKTAFSLCFFLHFSQCSTLFLGDLGKIPLSIHHKCQEHCTLKYLLGAEARTSLWSNTICINALLHHIGRDANDGHS